MVFRTRIMARLALAGLCLCVLGYSQCTFISGSGGKDDPGLPSVTPTYTTTLILRDSTGTATTNFVFGEPIRFDLEIQNSSSVATTLTFPDAQTYDFYVLDPVSSGPRWRWSENMVFAQVVTTLNFAPYATKAYSVVWNGVLSNGTQLPAGSYRARGVIVASGYNNDPLMVTDLGSNIVYFTVR